jgi:predicted peptidase
MGIDLFVRNQQTVPAFILAPQSSGRGWVSAAATPQLLAVPDLIGTIAKQYSIDTRRVYVGGQSLGGYGTYALVAARPEIFAAAFVLCGGGDPARAPRLARVPFWIFHGSADDVVPVSEAYTMRDAIRRAGGTARYTEYRGEGHLIWPHVAREKELPPWLFSQIRPRTAPSNP